MNMMNEKKADGMTDRLICLAAIPCRVTNAGNIQQMMRSNDRIYTQKIIKTCAFALDLAVNR